MRRKGCLVAGVLAALALLALVLGGGLLFGSSSPRGR